MATTTMPTTQTPLQEAYSKKAAAQQAQLPVGIQQMLGSCMPQIPAVLPADITIEQFRSAVFLELSGRPELANCTPASLRDCVLKAAMYGLLPGRDCHFLPFGNRGKGEGKGGNNKIATYVPNYFGILRVLDRSGKVRRAFAHPVCDGDEWGFDLFQDRPVHKPAVTLGKKPGKERFYYGAIMFHDGTCAFEVMSLDDLEAIKKRAPSHENGPWVTDAVMMKRKTALKRVAKYVQLTPQLRALIEEDDARLREDIPPTRHQQNIIDLFGEPSNPTAFGLPQPGAATEEHDPETGEVIPPDAGQPNLWQQEEAGEKPSNAGVEGSN